MRIWWNVRLQLDHSLHESDVAQIRALTAATGFFTAEEVQTAGELAEETLENPQEYHFLFLRDAEAVMQAYSCYSEIPLTEGSYDLYWIVVAPELQGKGQGRLLLHETENAIRQIGGRQLYAETSGTPKYHSTREFYLHMGFAEIAVFKDFYRVGDDKVVYAKTL